MTPFLARKIDGSLRPVDERGAEVLAKIGPRDVVTVEVKRARNPQHHRKLWALAKIVADNSEVWSSAEQVITALKIATGHVETFVIPGTDRVYEIPKSISFSSMDQTAFAEFYDRCIEAIVTRWLPGVTSETLRAEVEMMIT